MNLDADYLDITYTADLLIGDANQAIPVIFDTTTEYLVIEGCASGCTTPHFDISSTSAHWTAGTALVGDYG